MNNAEKFEKTFGIYATEMWAMPESEFLSWLNSLHDVNATNTTDTISRQAAIETLIKADRNCGIDSAEVVKDMPSAEPQWIPCSERLPEENGNYLVTAIWNGKREVDMDYFQFLCQWDDYKDTVVAWMPLPEPYEGTCHTFGYTRPTNG